MLKAEIRWVVLMSMYNVFRVPVFWQFIITFKRVKLLLGWKKFKEYSLLKVIEEFSLKQWLVITSCVFAYGLWKMV